MGDEKGGGGEKEDEKKIKEEEVRVESMRGHEGSRVATGRKIRVEGMVVKRRSNGEEKEAIEDEKI